MTKLDLPSYITKHVVTFDQVASVPVPENTVSYAGIGHERLYQLVRKDMQAASLTVVDEVHSMMRYGTRYLCLLQLRDTPKDYAVIVGLRNSYDREYCAGLLIGVAIPGTRSISMAEHISMRHRRYLRDTVDEMPRVITKAVDDLWVQRSKMEGVLLRYKITPISDERAHHIIMLLILDKTLKLEQLRPVLKLWKEPQVDCAKNLFRLFIAISSQFGVPIEFNLKRSNAMREAFRS